MGKISNIKLKQFMRKSTNKKDLIERITKEDPDYVITNLTNIERLADIHFGDEKKNKNRKNKDESMKKKQKKTKYQTFVQENFQNIREKYETNSDTMKAIAEMWKTSSENPRNGSGFIENI